MIEVEKLVKNDFSNKNKFNGVINVGGKKI